MKRHKSVYSAYQYICYILILLVSLQFPYLVFISVQASLASNETPQHFKDIDFTNITNLDLIARKAMKRLHDDLDHDDDGNVSLIEGAQFIDREDFESRNSNLPSFATDKDGRITETEFWETWLTSSVHNWTVAEMAEWLSSDVDLPQYAEKFKQFSISGAAMPILLDGSYNALRNIGVYPSAHKRKIQLRAMEVVIFGPPKPKSSLFKDILLTISIALALSGMVYAVHVRRSANLAVVAMQEKLNNLQNEMSKLDEDEWSTKNSGGDDFGEGKLLNRELSSSQASLTSELHLQSRLHEVMDELSDARSMLELTKERLNDQKWLPPDRLVVCLKATHKVEAKLHESKRHQAQKKVEQAKTQFLKMKKKTSIFNSVQLVHSHQVDNFDLEVQAAKDFLSEVQREAHEFKKRWLELESICKCRFITSSSRVAMVKRHQSNNDVLGNQRIKSDGNGSTVIVKSRSIQDGESDGLQMKVVHSHSTDDQKNSNVTQQGSDNSIVTQQSCPSLAAHSEPRNAQSAFTTSQSLTHQRTSSFNRISFPNISDRDRFSDRFRSLPRKLPSPLMARNKMPAPIRRAVTPQSQRKIEGSQDRRQSLEPNENETLSKTQKSRSSHSLPDLLSSSEDLATSNELKTSENASQLAPESDNAKPLKKRSFFGTKFKKKKTQ